MSRWDQRYLGFERFPDALSLHEIQRYFTPTAEEITVIHERRSNTNRIGFALQLGFLKMAGRPLNKIEIVPRPVLEHLGVAIGRPAPHIATLRALYRRRRTLFEHQAAAQQLLGRVEITDHAQRGLTAYLRREVIDLYTIPALMDRARLWLVARNYLLLREKDIRRLAVMALRHQEHALAGAIQRVADQSLRDTWAPTLLAARADEKESVLEWLQSAPRSRSARALDDQLAKVQSLRTMGADRLGLDVLPLAGLEHFARRVTVRRPRALATIKEPRRTLELACFLRLQLLRLTDKTLTLVDSQIARHWREARERSTKSQEGRLARFRGLLASLSALTTDEAVSAEELRAKLSELIAPFSEELDNTAVTATRVELASNSRALGHLLRSARSVGLAVPPDHKLAKAFATLDPLAGKTAAELAPGAANPFGRSWQSLIDQTDRQAALKCFQAAAAMQLKRALKNRSVTAKDSLEHRAPEEHLIPRALWDRDRGRYLRDLAMPATADRYVIGVERRIKVGLAALAAAVDRGEIAIDDEGFCIPARKPAPKVAMVEQAREAISKSLGTRHLPDIIVEVDSHARVSGILLGRPARSERELITLYAALLALATGLAVSELARMIPDIDVDRLGGVIARVESEPRLRAANDAVVGFMRRHRVTNLWGAGVYASADMMSLDATRRLWNARLDPRRKGPAIGTYPHVLDQWSIFYDQPLVLNRWQAGAAIEGALRQTVVEKLDRVSVDTHGFTHFAMALAKIVGFDLCPRLAGLKTRKLHLPQGFSGKVPTVLESAISPEIVSRRAIARGWDELMRLGASVKDGWYPATHALEQYSSAAQGNVVHAAGVGLGKLLRTIYLCDYLANMEFRDGILDLLNQGEAVHSLQRRLHERPIAAKRGRSYEEMTAISGALTLLTNIVMAWNTHYIQAQIDVDGGTISDEVASQLAPISHGHINLRGIMTFKIGAARSVLLDAAERSTGPSQALKS